MFNPNHCGWCGGARRKVLEALAAGKAIGDVAKEMNCTRGFVQSSIKGALLRGCLTEKPAASGVRRGKSKTCIKIVCATCNEPAVVKRAGSRYCSSECGAAGRRAGMRVYEKADVALDLGPEEPLIKPDVEGMFRRALEAAMDGVDQDGMYSRFPSKLAERAISEARLRGGRLDASLSAGIPV